MTKIEKKQLYRRKNSLYKGHTVEKKLFLMLVLTGFMLFLLVPFVSALDFLPIKDYDESTRTITISNFLGIGRDVSTIQLNTPLDYRVGAGYQKVAEFEIDLFDDTYSNAFKEMEFYDLNNNEEKFERNFDYKYKTTELVDVNNYKQVCELSLNRTKVCENVLVGTHQEEKEVWKDLDTSILIKGKITIGIFTEVKVGDYVEWIPTLFGKEIDEWATWTASLNVGLVSRWDFEETSGVVIDERGVNNGTAYGVTRGQTGKIGNAFYFDGDDFVRLGDDTTISFAGIAMM